MESNVLAGTIQFRQRTRRVVACGAAVRRSTLQCLS